MNCNCPKPGQWPVLQDTRQLQSSVCTGNSSSYRAPFDRVSLAFIAFDLMDLKHCLALTTCISLPNPLPSPPLPSSALALALVLLAASSRVQLLAGAV